MPQTALENLIAGMTLAELATRSGRSVEAIVSYAMNGRSPSNGEARSKSTTSTTASKPAQARRTGKVNTRTPAGRAAYEAALLGALQASGKPTLAQELRRKVGGAPTQARATLNRLIEIGKVSSVGQARATRYLLA